MIADLKKSAEQKMHKTVDALKPAVLHGADPNYLYLLMPVRVS